MFSARAMFGLAIVLLAACEGRGQPVTELVGGAAPFEQLEGVRLGMGDKELMERRPNVRHLGEDVYGESIDEFEIRYMFPLPLPLIQRFKVNEIRALRRYDNASHAVRAWEEQIPELKQRLGVPSECATFVTPFVEGRMMIWARDGVEVTHSVTHERTEGGLILPEGQEVRVVALGVRSHTDSRAEGVEPFSCP